MRCKFRTGIRLSILAAWFIRSGNGIKPPSSRNALGIAGHGLPEPAVRHARGRRREAGSNSRGRPVWPLAASAARPSRSRGFGFRARHGMVKPPLHTCDLHAAFWVRLQ
jgi:hypothetical protein